MKNRLTVLVDEKNIKFVKKYAKQKNTSVSFLLNQFMEDLHQKAMRRKTAIKDPWVEKYAGIFSTGSKDILEEMFGKKRRL
jgi:hypothetical protein